MADIGGIHFKFKTPIPFNPFSGPPQIGMEDSEINFLIGHLQTAVLGSSASVALFKPLQNRTIYLRFDNLRMGFSGAAHGYLTFDPTEEFKAGPGNLSTVTTNGQVEAILLGYHMAQPNGAAKFWTPTGAYMDGDVGRELFHELVHAVTVPAMGNSPFKSSRVNTDENIAIAAENLIWVPAHGGSSRVGHGNPGGASIDPAIAFKGLGSANFEKVRFDGQIAAKFAVQSGPETLSKWYLGVGYTATVYSQGKATGRRSLDNVTLLGVYGSEPVVSSKGVPSAMVKRLLSGALSDGKQTIGALAQVAETESYLTDLSDAVRSVFGTIKLATALSAPDLSQVNKALAISNETSVADIRKTGPIDATTGNPATSLYLHGVSSGTLLIGGSGDIDSSHQIDFGRVTDTLVAGGAGAATNNLIAGTGKTATAGVRNELIGGVGADYLVGQSGDDSLVGGKGDDVLIKSAGSDWLDGGSGINTVVLPQDSKLAETVDMRTVASKGYGTITDGHGTSQVKNVQVVIGGAGKATFYGSGHNVFIAGSGGAEFHLQSGDVAIANPNSKVGNVYYVTSTDITKNHIGIVGIGKNDKLYVDGQLFNGSTAFATSLGESYDSNHDGPGNAGVFTRVSSGWETKVTQPHLYDTFDQPPENGLRYHYWINGSDLYTPSPQSLKDVTYVKSTEQSGTSAGDIYFTSQTADGFGSATLDGALDISVIGWQQGYAGINFYENNLARDTLGAFSIGGGVSGWNGQILGGNVGANAAINPGFYKLGDDLTAVGGLFDPSSSEWQTTDPSALSTWDQIDQLISSIIDDTADGDDLPDWSPFGPSGDDGGGGPGPLGYSAGDGDDLPAAVPLQGDASANLLDPAGGYDEVIGGGGGDTVVYNLGYGSLVIDEQDSDASPSNVLEFGADILPGDVTVDGNADGDLVLTVAEDSTITIKGALQSTATQTNGVQHVTFSDGTIWTYSDLLAAVSTAASGRVAIYGDNAANTLDVAGDATSAVGGGGGDTFVFEAGYGDVTIDERDVSSSDVNTLAFGAGLDAGTAFVTADSDGSLSIDFGTGDRVTIANALLSDDDTTCGVQQVTFADGTTWSYADLLSLADTASVDNRALYGDRSGNYLWGGGVATSLTGGGGGDTFEFDRGDRPITIYETDNGTAPANQLYLNGFDPGDITVSANAAGDLLLLGDGAVQITIASALNGDDQLARGVQSVSFGDGTTWSYSDLVGFATTASSDNLELFGDSQANLFNSMGLASSIVGHGGGDTIVYERGYGALSVVEADASSSATNTLQFGIDIAAADVAVSGDADGDLVLSLGNGDTITLVAALLSTDATANGLQAVTFVDGTSWTYADLLQRALAANSGGTIVGDTAANTIDSGGVAAHAIGNGGGDTFLFNAGYGALTIDERDIAAVANNGLSLGIGLDPASTTVSATTDGDLVLSFGGGDSITLVKALQTDGADVFGVQTVKFHDGTSWSYADLLAKVSSPTGGSTIFGDRSSNVLDAAGLAASVVGAGGGDIIVFNEGYGQVTLLEADHSSSPDNVVQFGAGIDPGQVSVTGNAAGDIVLDIGGGDSIILENALHSSPDCTYGIQQVEFEDGTTWNYDDILAILAAPSSSNTTLYGDSGANVLDGAGVANVLVGNGGDDTFLFGQGDGALTIDEQDSAGLPDNRLVLGTGILTTDVAVSATANGDLVLTMTGDDEITLKNALSSGVETAFGVQEVEFDDGTIWTYADLVALAAAPSSSQTTLYGDKSGNEFDGEGIAHRIVGAGGGDDFYYARGYGALSIDERDAVVNPTNCLTFGPDIAPDDVTVSTTSGGDILLSLGGGDLVTLEAANTSVAGVSIGVQQVKFSGGLSWNAAQLKAIVSGAWAIADDGGFTAIDEAVNFGSSTPVIQLAFSSTDTTVALGDDRQSLTLSSANGTVVAIDDLLRIGAGTAQTITFSDGITWSLNDAIAQGTSTADTINYEVGTSAAESFNFANGVKEVIGFGGGDRIRYDRGDGYVVLDETDHSVVPDNVLAFGPDIALSDLTITSDGANLFLALPDGDEVVLSNALRGDESASYGVQRVRFDDGTEATYAQLLAIADTGSVDNSGTLYGDANANVIDSASFSHTVVGAGGADTVIYNRGYGDLEIADPVSSGGTTASILFGADITTADIAIEPDEGNGYSVGQRPAMKIIVAGEGTVTIDNQLSGGPAVSQLVFANGTTLDYADMLALLGTPVAGRQAIGGDYGANDLDTQGLVHEVIGNGGGDTIRYDRGYGALNIREDDASPAANNKLVFATGIDPSDVAASLSYQGIFSLDLGAGDVVSFRAPQLFAGSGIEEVDFADGTVWDSAQLLQIVDTGAPGKIFMQGTSLDETFDGRGYTRYISGYGGADTYIFNQGDGAETIYDSGYFGSNPNTISFGVNIDPTDVSVSQYNGNLILSVGASDRVLVLSQFAYNNYYGVQRVTFDDGTVWNAATLTIKATAAASGSAAVIDLGSGTSDEIGLPTLLSGDLTTSDTLSFTDDDIGDVHQVSVVNVSFSSTSFTQLPDQTEMLSYLSAAVATEPGANPGTIEWSFSAPVDKFSALAPGESVDMTFTLLLKDENNAVTTQNVIVSVVSPESGNMQSSSFVSSKMASYDDGYRTRRLFLTERAAADFALGRSSWKKVDLASLFEPDVSMQVAPSSVGSSLASRGSSLSPGQTYELASVVRDGDKRAMVARQAGVLAQSLASFGVADAGDMSSYSEGAKQDLLLALARHEPKSAFQGGWDLAA